ncbi:hypothetical protein BH11PSE10_BH11PSE10_08820 [soil metagenome]
MSPTLYRPLLAGLMVMLLTACGTPTQSLTMALAPADALQLRSWVPDGLKGNVELDSVKGGEVTGRWWGSKVSSLVLSQAVEDSLRSVGMLPMAPVPGAKYLLRVQLLSLDQPLAAAQTTVTAAIQYSLVAKADGTVIYQRAVRTTGTAGLGDALLSQTERLRLANEAAVRANIAAAVRDLLVVKLPESAAR